jgi:hypothetical protein
MAEMIQNMQLDLTRFIAQWPNDSIALLATLAAATTLQDCPKKQFRFTEKVDTPFDDPRDLVVTRMPFAPMTKVEQLLQDLNRGLRIGYLTDDGPAFCYQRERPGESLDRPSSPVPLF